ncbi:MAG: hypothetical protein R3B96_22010 [Pirellulaceae bacterium]
MDRRRAAFDYSRLQSQLQSLVDAKQCDAVVELGRELLEIGLRQVEEAHGEGPTVEDVAETLAIVAEAIEGSSLSDADKILFAIHSRLQDNSTTCGASSIRFSTKTIRQRFGRKSRKTKQAYPPRRPTNKTGQSIAQQLLPPRKTHGLDRRRIEGLRGDAEAATNFCIEEALRRAAISVPSIS